MTTIRKIPTSKIEGDTANNTNTNEIRPFGELAVYINEDGPTQKLELLMFDGARTHLRSKVLSKGTFYGGDADSADIGDGIQNFDTIKLIPDAELHYNGNNYGNDQYLIIDPTGPDHIHIRAGGTIDNSTAVLKIGGELTAVSIDDQSMAKVTISASNNTGDGSHTWSFYEEGDFILPEQGDILEQGFGNTVIGGGTRFYELDSDYLDMGDPTNNRANIILVRTTTTSDPTEIILPADGTARMREGYEITIADIEGSASTYPITIYAASGDTLIGSPTNSIIIDTNYGMVQFKYLGKNLWLVMYGR